MSNSLYPIFLNLERLPVLVIGGGKIALQKLESMLGNAPETSINLVAKEILPEIKKMGVQYPQLTLHERAYSEQDFKHIKLVVLAVNNVEIAEQIRAKAHQYKLLVNVVDKPMLCDFYLGAIVKKGNLKIAISTNGKSPTMAKRLRETFSESIPEEIDEVLENMHKIRHQLKGDFDYKVEELNKLTTQYLFHNGEHGKQTLEIEKLTRTAKMLQRKANIYLGIIGGMLLVGVFGLIVYQFNLWGDIQIFLNQDGHIFYWMLFVGFLAELVAGSMGMGYGVICTTTLLLLNIPPQVVSASIHSAESFTTAAGSFSHYKLGNVNKKLVWALVPIAIVGAVIGAFTVSHYGEYYAHIVKPIIACYTLYLGLNILRNAFKKKSVSSQKPRKKTNLQVLGFLGGFIDSFAGGGWGPLVTGSLMKEGRTPRYVIGSSTVAKFLLTVSSALTFIFTLGVQHWNIVLGLLLGGIFTAPFSAMLTAKLPTKKMFMVVGILVIIMSLTTIVKALI
ncbi:TSUP family transporter [Elizabethkingia argentiflava]|uniref:Probable membrane transporter protein n=1 Tax=Elizabethkingia argenteiflava TaxID=2681556 RepID=A0A845PS01_9FLAO|nr:TSUP family transporter [Elizabethkingia argenteiflava]NAW50445.1 TSUP family transporter [Elizabethkingia argenteiflava]